MYTKPTLSVVNLAVESNSCDCAGGGVTTKLNPANAVCGGFFMTTTTMTAN